MNKETQMWIICSEISFMIEQTNKYPTIKQVKQYPSVAINCSDIEDGEIERAINKMREMDEREFLNRHNSLSDCRPGYYGFKKIVEDENGGLRFVFVTNDDLCKKLAERIFNY